MTQRRVLVCCGTGIATSVQVSHKLQRMLKERGVSATMSECRAIDLQIRAEAVKPQVIVSTTHVKLPGKDIPIYSGVPFLTGIGADALADQIADQLRSNN